MVTITPSLRETTYAPVSPTTDFPVGFPIFGRNAGEFPATDLAVVVNDEVHTDFTVIGDFVEGVSTNAFVRINVPVTGDVIVRGKRTPRRTDQYLPGAPLKIEDHNYALNRLEAEMQEVRRDTDENSAALDSIIGDVTDLTERAEAAAQSAEEDAKTAEEAKDAAVAAAGNNWHNFDTAVSVTSIEIPSIITNISTAGYTTVGDGGDALYSRVAVEPNHEGWVRSADGGIFSITKRTVRTSQFGALPGLDDLHLRIADAVNYLNEIGGGELQIDHNDEYVLSGRILPNILTSDILITNPALGVLKAGLGQAVPILDLRASNTPGAVTNRILRLHDLRYDCSQGSTPSEGQYCTALNTQYFQQVIEDGTFAYGGVFGNNNSDSGHTPTANVYTKITNGRFIGFGDNGVYATGDNTTGSGGDGYSCEIINCDFEECNGAGQGKRELTLFKIHGGTVKRCASGFGSSEVYPTGPARNMIIENVFFDQVTANIAQFRGPTKGGMWNCYIRDWGRTIGTDESVGANAVAIVVRGASRLNFSGNHFTRVNWALDDQRAYNLQNLTIFPGQAEETTYIQGEHHFEGNHYGGIARVYVEDAGGNPSVFLEETTRSIPSGRIWNSTFNNNHVLTYMNIGSARRYTFQGGLEYVRPNLPDLVKNYSVNTSLIADDSGCLITNQGQSAKRTFTLPTAIAGLSYKFMNMDAAGMRVQANSGDVIRINGSQSASAGYADSSTSLGVSIELVAVDNTNWVAKSYTGTWTLG